MNTLLAVSLAALACLLFYRFVERRHKVLFAKLAGAIGILVALGAFVLWGFERRRASRRQRVQASVSVLFAPDSAYLHRYSSDNPFLSALVRTDTLSAIAFRLCNGGIDTVTSVSFRPVTWRRQRSTKYNAVVSTEPYTAYAYVDPQLSSDYILAPKACVSLTWTASSGQDFVLMDTTAAADILVSTRDDN